MSLFNQINEDIKISMKNKDAFKLSVIRMVKGAMQLEVINKKVKPYFHIFKGKARIYYGNMVSCKL